MSTAIEALIKRISENSKSEIFEKFSPGLSVDLLILNDAPYYSISIRNEDSYIHLSAFWRYISNKRIVFSVDDDKQLFGLRRPFSILDTFGSDLQNKRMIAIRIAYPISDLFLFLDDDSYIEILANSGGFESWSFSGSDKSIICLGGGELACFTKFEGRWVR